jgi:hypothetical protein
MHIRSTSESSGITGGTQLARGRDGFTLYSFQQPTRFTQGMFQDFLLLFSSPLVASCHMSHVCGRDRFVFVACNARL